MKNFYLLLLAMTATMICHADCLRLNPENYRIDSLVMPDNNSVAFKAYEGIYYVENVEDSVYQTLNLYVPMTKAEGKIPILLRTYVGGYMAAKAQGPSATDATGRALQEGYVVCIPGSRGRNSTIEKDGKTIYTGKAPNTLLDLKAAVRYLRHNKDILDGDTELIFTDGTSAGGAMSSLLGATGNAKVYEPLLKEMGAADERDDVFAAICYCPITDLNHADMEYEWLYGCTNTGVRHLDATQIEISNELSNLCPEYINSLELMSIKDGKPIDAENYKDYISEFLMESAHRALEEGCEIPDSIGIQVLSAHPFGMVPRRDGPSGRQAPSFGPGGAMRPPMNNQSDFVTGIDLEKYLSYVASQTHLKTPPAFDQMGVIIPNPSPENEAFGNIEGEPANFTNFSLQHRLKNDTATLTDEMLERVMMYNPMDFIGAHNSDIAPNWYIRHGAKDRDTSFLVPINLATKLQNLGYSVDFFLPWNRPHSGDYNLDDLFRWIAQTLSKN